MESELGGPSTGSPTGTPSDVKGMHSSLKHCSSNGVTNGNDHLLNGHCEGEEELKNGLSSEITEPGGRQRQLSTLEKDIVCLIGQHLRESGYSKTLECLMEESGCVLEHPKATSFRTHVINGCWREASKSLEEMAPLLGDSNCIEKMQLLLFEEKYLELLEKGDFLLALQCLRHELNSLPVHHPDRSIQDLMSYMMCNNKEDLHRQANWPGVEGGARERLMDKLQAFLPVSVMLPPRRLELLLRQAVQLQVDKCPFHYLDQDVSSYSLLTDHICPRCNFPSETVHVLKDHTDEVWFVKFSNDGQKLASGSKDGQIIVWKIEEEEFVKQHVIKGHGAPVAGLSWSPDDSLLLACGHEDCSDILVYDAETGAEKCKVSQHPDDSLTCCAWHHTGKKFYAGGSRGQFYECSPEDGAVTGTWEGVRVQAIAASPCKDIVYAADSHKRIRQYCFQEKSSSTLVKEDHPIMAFTLSLNGRYALLNVASQGVHVWDLADRCLVHRYQGVTQGFYTIHSCYGVSDTFLASGSEDHRVYVWNHRRETPVIVLQGHNRTVNCVTWNPVHQTMIASASDDGTVRVWGTEKDLKRHQEVCKLQEEAKLLREVRFRMSVRKYDPMQSLKLAFVSTGPETNGTAEQNGFPSSVSTGEVDDEEEEGERMDTGRLPQQMSEADLQAIETLEPESSQEESSGSVERLEAAVSLSSLSLGLQSMSPRGTSSPQSRESPSGAQAMLVIVHAPPAARADMHRSFLTHQDSETRSLESSMESENSRHLESLQSVLAEVDSTPQPQMDEEVVVGTTGIRTSSSVSAADSGVVEQPLLSISLPALSAESSNGTSGPSFQQQQQQQQQATAAGNGGTPQDGQPSQRSRATPTGSSRSTVV